VNGEQIELKHAVIMAMNLMHCQIMPSFVHLLLRNVTSHISPEVASALTVILQNPVSLQALGEGIYQPVIRFLSQCQSYFVEMKISDTREI
jgi:hypothetical protein